MCEESSVVITDNLCDGKGEMFCNFYKCPNCNVIDIIREMKYCPGCGKKLIWKIYEERGINT